MANRTPLFRLRRPALSADSIVVKLRSQRWDNTWQVVPRYDEAAAAMQGKHNWQDDLALVCCDANNCDDLTAQVAEDAGRGDRGVGAHEGEGGLHQQQTDAGHQQRAPHAERLAGGGGTLCVFSSVAGDRGRKPVVIYGSSKAGLSYYLEGLDHKYRAQGLKTVCGLFYPQCHSGQMIQ